MEPLPAAADAAGSARPGRALRRQGRYREAEEELRAALRLAERAYGAEGAAVAEVMNELGVLYKYTARFDEAETLYRRALRILEAHRDDFETATVWHNLGGLEHARGRPALAEPAARRAVELRTRAVGPDHPAVAADAAALAAILDQLGRVEEAEAMLCRALDVFTRLLGPDHHEVAVNANNLAALRFRRGDHGEAEALWEHALAIKRKRLGPTHPELAPTLVNLGVLAATRGQVERARSLFTEALRILGPDVGADHPARRAASAGLARIEEQLAFPT